MANKSLFKIHNGEVWFRYNIGKLTLSRMGHSLTLGTKYWFEARWDGICFMKVGWYV